MISTKLIDESLMPETKAQAALKVMQFEGIPDEKLKDMVAYASKLRKNNPNMKPDRVKKEGSRVLSYKINLRWLQI